MTTLAILGLGSIGMRHARNILTLGHKVLGYDPAEKNRQALTELGGNVAGSAAKAIGGADAVVIATPSGQHLADVDAVIAAGRHVFVEKPLAHTVEGVEALLDKADAGNIKVFAGLNQRFNPAVIAARDLIKEGKIGDILWARLISSSYLPDWRPHQDHRNGYAADSRTGGVIFDVIHEFDIANYLLGPAKTIAATSRNTGLLGIESEDCADIVLQHEGGHHASIHLDYVTRPRRRNTEIAGTLGVLAVDLAGRRLELTDISGNQTLSRKWETTVDEDYRQEIASFLRCVETRENPACDGREALTILRQVISARQLCGLPQS